MKVKINKPTASDCGEYNGMKNVQWESVVEAEYMNDKKKAILVSGEEFIRIGGCPEAFKQGKYVHVWGTYEVVEE